MNRVTRTVRQTFAPLVLALIVPSLAHAQASRTWVSGVGDDVNPCSRTAPCKTFAGAISKTANPGEISVLDPGGFGAVSIVNRTITITGEATLGSVLVVGGNGINVSVGPNDVVILRHLEINGDGASSSAVNFTAGGSLIIEDSNFYGFTGNTVNVNLSGGGNLKMKNTTIQGGGQGVGVKTAAGVVNVALDNVDIRGTNNAIHAVSGFTNITNSLLTQNTGIGVLADLTSTITIERSSISNNGVALQVQPGATIRMTNNGIYDNGTTLVCNGGQMLSRGDNRVDGGGGCAPTGTVPVQ
jgi:hypothetical protein